MTSFFSSFGAGIALAGTVVGFSVANTVYDFSRVQPKVLEIAELYYHETDGLGYITQKINSVSGVPVTAEWAVQIQRHGADGAMHQVCGGTNNPGQPGIYDGDVDTFDLDFWANDDCPDTLQAGDRVEASWTWRNEHGIYVSVGTDLIIR